MRILHLFLLLQIPLFSVAQCDVSMYEAAIFYLKCEEGIRLKKYRCIAGVETIGYGDTGSNRETITLKEANKELTKKFLTLYDEIEQDYPILKRNQVIAIALFSFNLGKPKHSSELHRRLICGDEIDDVIVKYCHYRSKGVLKKHKGLLRRRKVELMFYKNENLNEIHDLYYKGLIRKIKNM